MKSVFLCCALALPLLTVPQENRHYDVSLFRYLIREYNHYRPKGAGKNKSRIYTVGGDRALLMRLRTVVSAAFRLTMEPETPFDVMGFQDAIPFARESARAVIYLLEVASGPFDAMVLFDEATYPLGANGLIVFYAQMAPEFPMLARARGFERLPFDWYEMQVWRKRAPIHGKFKHDGLSTIGQSA